MENNCKINESCLMYMFRYCLSRQSYAVTDGVNAVLDNWDVISPLTKDYIVKEIMRDMEKMYRHERSYIEMMEWKKIVDRYEKENNNEKE